MGGEGATTVRACTPCVLKRSATKGGKRDRKAKDDGDEALPVHGGGQNNKLRRCRQDMGAEDVLDGERTANRIS